jgi:hypothetical protein
MAEKSWWIGYDKSTRTKRARVEADSWVNARWALMTLLQLGPSEIQVEPTKVGAGFTPFIGVNDESSRSRKRAEGPSAQTAATSNRAKG